MRFWHPLTLLLVSCLSGCAHLGGWYEPQGMLAVDRQEVAGGKIAPDVSSVGSTAELGRQLSLPTGKRRALTAQQCQCLAVANGTVVRLVEMERQIACCKAAKHGKKGERAALQAELLGYRQEEEENHAAGAALEIFYRLAEAEAQRSLLADARQSADSALHAVDLLRQQGLELTVDIAALTRQKGEIDQRSVEIDLGTRQATGKLIELLKLDDDPQTGIWPVDDWKVVVAPIDIDQAIATGLAMRAELKLLRRLANDTSSNSGDNLSATRSALQQRDPSLGTGGGWLASLCKILGHPDCESSVRQAQLKLLLADREEFARQEIRTTAATVYARLRQIASAKEKLASWETRLGELEKKRTTGGATAFDVLAAKVQLGEAQAGVISAVMAWKIALVKFDEAQGLLGQECR